MAGSPGGLFTPDTGTYFGNAKDVKTNVLLKFITVFLVLILKYYGWIPTFQQGAEALSYKLAGMCDV